MDKKQKTKIGKFIALILRHHPEKLDLDMDKNGWVDVEKLIENSDINFTFSDLLEIVDSDDKKRYSFNSDFSKIRANQGHSIDVDLELKEIIPPKFLFHGTAEKNRNKIIEEGINKKSRKYVHLSEDISVALNVGKRHGNPIVLRINAKKMHEDGFIFYLSENDVFLVDFVPSKYINTN